MVSGFFGAAAAVASYHAIQNTAAFGHLGNHLLTKQTNMRTSRNLFPSEKQSNRSQQIAVTKMSRDDNRLRLSAIGGKHKSTSKRKRKRKDDQKMEYGDSSQRKTLRKKGKFSTKTKWGMDDRRKQEVQGDIPQRRLQLDDRIPIIIATEFGMNLALQSCDAAYAVVGGSGGDSSFCDVEPVEQPRIVGQVRVSGGDGEGSISGRYAYVIEKPAGWSILDNGKRKKQKLDATGSNAQPILSVGGIDAASRGPNVNRKNNDLEQVGYSVEERKRNDWVEYNERDILTVMSPEELAAFEETGGIDSLSLTDADGTAATSDFTTFLDDMTDDRRAESLVEDTRASDLSPDADIDALTARQSVSMDTNAILSPPSRPSLVSWFKHRKAAEGTPVRGGKHWKAIAGAVDIDDSGLVVLCPKDKIDSIIIDHVNYVAVVGNGKHLAPNRKKQQQRSKRAATREESKLVTIAKVRKARGDDIVVTVKVSIPDLASTCNDVVKKCQVQFKDGIRGDPDANPLDRRASRRLIHCASLSLSTSWNDGNIYCESVPPDDVQILCERRNLHVYKDGSFLGRKSLRENKHTTAYREINGAADGFPGWIVDRYDKWLLVQHDKTAAAGKGPLPSIHDRNTAGVYYFATEPDRSIMGTAKGVKPMLLEGQPAPETVPIKENGITYHVNFRDFSPGIFLDQRPQRMWLARHCTKETRVLNCFAHCGAFSIAAAIAGAETVSLDLDKKWLDRIEPQMMANGIINSERHGCIYGDCFDWLVRMAKRGDRFDVVILDPPSTSVGKKKKRWSAKNHYDELVSLAAPLVKRGGLLWTTTNSASIPPIKFARMCKKGLVGAGIPDAKLERIAPMPSDFPSIGPSPVKNLVWRIP